MTAAAASACRRSASTSCGSSCRRESLPGSGRVGFEIFDRTQFGATQFLEQVNYRRALEGEIARTIGTISEVSSARVHIAMGKDSLFGEPRPAKASVVLKLRGSRPPSPATIAGIGNLVASSVEGLRPESVVILDSYGRPLARPQEGESDPLGAAHMERQQRLEREMSARVVALLEPVVGPDRVRVNVAIKLDPQSLEETEERWDPNTVVRSRQASADQANRRRGPGRGRRRARQRAGQPRCAAAAAAGDRRPELVAQLRDDELRSQPDDAACHPAARRRVAPVGRRDPRRRPGDEAERGRIDARSSASRGRARSCRRFRRWWPRPWVSRPIAAIS